jgi:GMP synthase-like glutamine amidotransferase
MSMHIALLVTNTDRSPFAARHPDDAAKFATLVAGVRPGWRVTAFDLPAGDAAPDLARFDGALIGGSPTSVHDDAPWIGPLLHCIRAGFAAGVPLVGACFGHQAIALALGGQVGPNPGSFVLGAVETVFTQGSPWTGGAGRIRLAAAHGEQVTALPPGAEGLGHSPGCAVAAYRIGDRVFATQHHPEMTPAFLSALIDEFAPQFPPEVGQAARQSGIGGIEGPRFAEWIARFYELPRA